MFHLEQPGRLNDLKRERTVIAKHQAWPSYKLSVKSQTARTRTNEVSRSANARLRSQMDIQMENSFMNFQCRKCNGTSSVWAKFPDGKPHAYRVTCKFCGRFAGWGTEPQHQQLLIARKAIETVIVAIEPLPATLEDYF